MFRKHPVERSRRRPESFHVIASASRRNLELPAARASGCLRRTMVAKMRTMKTIRAAVSIAVFCSALGGPVSRADTTVTFDNGTEGWNGVGDSIDPVGGNPGANYHFVTPEVFGISLSNATSGEFVFDYTSVPSLTLGIDVLVEHIIFWFQSVNRPWLVQLRDVDNPPANYHYVSVWYKFADISAAEYGDWTSFSVTIDDTSATDLPPGWHGTGAEAPGAVPILPADRTFASVLAGVDQVVFTTFEPGYVFGYTIFILKIDNIAITIPEPSASLSIAASLVTLSWLRARRKQRPSAEPLTQSPGDWA